MRANRPTVVLLPAPSFAKPDIVRRFLAFAQCAGPEERAEGASALARAYLHSDLPPPVRAEAELAMKALLDDPSPLVRRALAAALGCAADAPRPFVLALAGDQSDVAAAVLSRSPVLTDADLVECVRNGDLPVHMALTGRPKLGRQAAAALAEVGQLDAVLAHIADVSARMLGRDYRNLPGAGAAGGLGFALAAFLGGRLEPGVVLIARETGLRELLAGAAYCMTGEGKIDLQTLHGKTVDGVAKLARERSVPVIAFAGVRVLERALFPEPNPAMLIWADRSPFVIR